MSARLLTRQPDDPGTDESNPFAPIVFEARPSGRYEAKLGVIIVGEVGPYPAYGSRLGIVRARWRCLLPDTASVFQPATSILTAQRKLSERVMQWVEAAGLRV